MDVTDIGPTTREHFADCELATIYVSGHNRCQCWCHDELGGARPTPVEPDPRCVATAGRCEKPANHEGDHYTEYREPVWSWRLAVEPDGLPIDVERLFTALANVTGMEWDGRAIAAEYALLRAEQEGEDHA